MEAETAVERERGVAKAAIHTPVRTRSALVSPTLAVKRAKLTNTASLPSSTSALDTSRRTASHGLHETRAHTTPTPTLNRQALPAWSARG